MSDKIYYRVQYPLKKAIQTLKELDREEEKLKDALDELSEYEKSRLNDLLENWEEEGRENLANFIEELRRQKN